MNKEEARKEIEALGEVEFEEHCVFCGGEAICNECESDVRYHFHKCHIRTLRDVSHGDMIFPHHNIERPLREWLDKFDINAKGAKYFESEQETFKEDGGYCFQEVMYNSEGSGHSIGNRHLWMYQESHSRYGMDAHPLLKDAKFYVLEKKGNIYRKEMALLKRTELVSKNILKWLSAYSAVDEAELMKELSIRNALSVEACPRRRDVRKLQVYHFPLEFDLMRQRFSFLLKTNEIDHETMEIMAAQYLLTAKHKWQ